MTYIMFDIHGNRQRFESVLSQIQLGNADRLYILGDVIDRFPDGIELVQRIRKMKNARLLLGNHEYMMLEAYADRFGYRRMALETKKAWRCWNRNYNQDTAYRFEQLTTTEQRNLYEYLRHRKRYLYITVNGQKFLLVHGASPTEYTGFQKAEYRSLTEFVVWHRFTDDFIPDDGSIMIFGHTPTVHYQSGDKMSIWHGNHVIGIDCGCGFHSGRAGIGCRLACLRLEDMKEFYSEE